MSYPKKEKLFETIQWEQVERVDGDILAGPYIKYLFAIDAFTKFYQCADFNEYEFWIVEKKDTVEWFIHFVPKTQLEKVIETMKKKTIQLPPKAPWEAMRIEMRDGAAHYICANGVPEQDASDLVQWARDLVDIWQEQQHICPNCRKGTNWGTDGVDCRVHDKIMSGDYDGWDDFGRSCEDFEPWPDEEEEKTGQ